MLDIPISVFAMNRTLTAAGQSQAPTKKTTAPKTDVIDLSKPLTPEEVERMRGAGFLGYGTISAAKTVTNKTMGSGATVTQVTMDFRHEYFDVTNGTAYQYESSGFGVFTSRGSAFVESTTQMTCTWEDGSWLEATLYESMFKLEMSGVSSYYIPPHLNEDGSWSLAEYGPSSRATISGYHSILSAAYSNGEETQYFWAETVAAQVKHTMPSGPLPDGASRLPPPCGCGQDHQDMVDRIGQLLDRAFDTRA